jgi:P4 family phage/plasmid primase-like protien
MIFDNDNKLKSNELCVEFNKIVLDKTGFNIQYVSKLMNDDYYSELDEVEEDDDNDDIDDEAFFNSIDTYTHNTASEIFYNGNKDKYIYSDKTGWYEYNDNNILINTGKEWPRTIMTNIIKYLQQHLINIRNRIKPDHQYYIRNCKNINKLIKDAGNINFISGVRQYLKELYSNDKIDDLIDSNVNLLAFNNKVYDYSIKSIRDIEKSDYICKNTKYDYKSSNKDVRNEMEKVLKSIFEDDEIYNYFMLTKALSLFGNKNESCFINIGSGGNGKGLISSLEYKALGDYVYTSENTFLTSTFKQGSANPTLEACKGVRILIVSEPEEVNEHGKQTALNTPFLKLITGGDVITARALFKSNISYIPQFTPFIQCNSTPNIKKVDGGIKRRMNMINFKLDFVDNPTKPNQRLIDTNLKTKLSDIKYYSEYLNILLDIATKTTNIKPIMPEKMGIITNKYFNDNNPIQEFIQTSLQIKQGSKIKCIDCKDVYEQRMNIKMSSSQFNKSMEFNGIEVYMLHGYRYFKNIELIEFNEDD